MPLRGITAYGAGVSLVLSVVPSVANKLRPLNRYGLPSRYVHTGAEIANIALSVFIGHGNAG